jgi:hypothetical protein
MEISELVDIIFGILSIMKLEIPKTISYKLSIRNNSQSRYTNAFAAGHLNETLSTNVQSKKTIPANEFKSKYWKAQTTVSINRSVYLHLIRGNLWRR